MRLQVFERDKWACRLCSATDKTLHAHHVFYRPGCEPWDYPIWAFLTLCADCHEFTHNDQREALANFVESVARRGIYPGDFALYLSVLFDRRGERQIGKSEAVEFLKLIGLALDLFETGVPFSNITVTNPQPADEPTI